jgi:hypothetical protein
MFNFNSGSPTVGATFDWKRYADPDNEERIGVDGINQLLINNSDTARTIIYKYIVTANGCLDTTWTIPVVVKPTPRLHTDFSAPKYFCSSPVVPFQFTDSSNTQGAVSWTWSRASTNHINKRPFPIYWDSASGVGNNGSRSFTDTLLSDHYDTLKVHYLFHISATGCHDTEDLTVIVKPIPVIDTASFKAISTICSETVFLNAPLSKTPGISITWSRAPVDSLLADGSTLGSSGAGTSEQLLKNIAVSKPDTVIYLDTLFAYGCYNPQTVTVIVAPVPVLTRYRDSVCSNSTLSYIPVPTYSGSTYKYGWTVITNTDNASLKASGRDRINEVVSSNSILRPVSVVYKFRDTFTINNVQCYSVDNDVRNTFTAVIKPQPVKPVITSTNPDPLDSTCQNVEYLNFTNIIPIDYVDGNVVYSWTSASAQIFNSTDAKRYNCLVTIPKNMTNTLIYNTAYVSGYQECAITDTFNIHSPDASRKVDSIGVVKFGNNLICNDNTVENYVWGYEDKATLTLHRLKQKGTQLDEINQNLYLPDHPDFSTDSNYYFVWTINAGNDCRQKSYYNAPGGVFKPESTTLSTEDFRLLAFPNPAQMTVTIELDGKRLDHLEAEVYDVTGRLLVAQPMNGNLVNISLADLPDGNYLVVCRHNGYKIATSRLVKN